MTRMIDGLGDVARAAGDSAADALGETAVIDSLEARIARGRRRRRQGMGGLAAVAVLVVGAGAVAVPPLLADAPVPAGPVEPVGPEVVRTDGAVTVYADGAMSVVTDSGQIVDLPAPSPEDPAYVAEDKQEVCTADVAALEPGWVYANPQAQELLGHGRPQYLADDYARQSLAQGQQLPPDRFNDFQPLAFELEADPAVADNIAFRAAVVATWEGTNVAAQSQLDAGPATWTVGEGTAQETAVIQMRHLTENGYSYCAEAAGLTDKHGEYLQRYLIVDVYVIDHAGSSTLLATHTSWTGTEFTQ